MDKPCELCGDIGFDDAIMICSQCKATHEHVYCMRIIYDGDPEKWVCDECQSPIQTPLPSPVLSKPIEGPKISSTLKRPPLKSKVQFLPPEEAMCLESGAPKYKFSPSKTPKKDETTSKKSLPPSFRVKPNPRVVPPGIGKPLIPRSMPRNSSDEKWLDAVKKKPATHSQHAWKEWVVDMGCSSRNAPTFNGAVKKVSGEGSGGNVCRGTAIPRPSGKLVNSNTTKKNNGARQSIQDSHTPSSSGVREIGEDSTKHVCQGTEGILKTSTQKENPYRKQPVQQLDAASSERGPRCESSDALTPLPYSELQQLIMDKCGDDDVCANTRKKRTNTETMESSKVALKFEKFLPNHPAESPTWRGNFNVTSDGFCGFYDGIIAHPPSKVHRKVYEVSKQLPELLQFELLPRLSLWVELFDEDIPGPIDIGLYFLPAKSCEETYSFLVKRVNECDMLLKSCVNGVELLIFSSKNLQDGCKKIDQRCFLWGVFRSCEDIVMVNNETSAGIEEDMEIDMIGGQEMENADKVVAKPAQAVLDVTPECLPVKVKEEILSPGSGSRGRDLRSLIEMSFERELQKTFDRFDAYVKVEKY